MSHFEVMETDRPEIQDKATMSRAGETEVASLYHYWWQTEIKSTMLMMRFNQIVIEVLVRLVKSLKKPVNPPNAMQAIQSVAVA
jgi:hypothetical protein